MLHCTPGHFPAPSLYLVLNIWSDNVIYVLASPRRLVGTLKCSVSGFSCTKTTSYNTRRLPFALVARKHELAYVCLNVARPVQPPSPNCHSRDCFTRTVQETVHLYQGAPNDGDGGHHFPPMSRLFLDEEAPVQHEWPAPRVLQRVQTPRDDEVISARCQEPVRQCGKPRCMRQFCRFSCRSCNTDVGTDGHSAGTLLSRLPPDSQSSSPAVGTNLLPVTAFIVFEWVACRARKYSTGCSWSGGNEEAVRLNQAHSMASDLSSISWIFRVSWGSDCFFQYPIHAYPRRCDHSTQIKPSTPRPTSPSPRVSPWMLMPRALRIWIRHKSSPPLQAPTREHGGSYRPSPEVPTRGDRRRCHDHHNHDV